MPILVVGSVALDTVQTPFGAIQEGLGGSATYFSTAASFFTQVRLVAVVGEDFPQAHVDFLQSRRVDLRGLQRVPGRTFRWAGKYEYDLNQAHTLDTQLNVFADFAPKIPAAYRDSEVVFLANIHPDLQRDVVRQVRAPKLVAADTMNFWIEGQRDSLVETLKHVEVLVINDAETRQLAQDSNLVRAARTICAWGPGTLVIKRGEHGALCFQHGTWFAAPALPLDGVLDPTGAGDCFAGGFMGYLAKTMDFSDTNMRRAVVMGSVMASFNVEAFSLDRLRTLTEAEIAERYAAFQHLAHFDGPW